METVRFNKDEIDLLANAISAEGESVMFTPEETKKSGRRYLIACSKNDEDERARRAKIMRDSSRIVVF